MNKRFREFLARTLFLKDIKCLFCGCELETYSKYCVCDRCLKTLPFLRGKVCAKCGEPIKSKADLCVRCKTYSDRGFDVARAEFLYDDVIADAIKELKYFGKKYYAEYLSNFLIDVFVRNNFDCDVVIPAPMSSRAEKTRGFNQVELLCKSFEDVGFTVNKNVVAKVLETQNQVVLSFKDRQTNLVGAFKVLDRDAIKNKNVLLVDDIFTTGATVSEISSVLKKAGANKVCVITLCHEVIKNEAKS